MKQKGDCELDWVERETHIPRFLPSSSLLINILCALVNPWKADFSSVFSCLSSVFSSVFSCLSSNFSCLFFCLVMFPYLMWNIRNVMFDKLELARMYDGGQSELRKEKGKCSGHLKEVKLGVKTESRSRTRSPCLVCDSVLDEIWRRFGIKSFPCHWHFLPLSQTLSSHMQSRVLIRYFFPTLWNSITSPERTSHDIYGICVYGQEHTSS